MNNLEATIVKQELLSSFDGYVCSDSRGLCVEAQGNMKPETSGYAKGIMDNAKQLTKEDGLKVTIECSDGVILITQTKDLTIAASKKK